MRQIPRPIRSAAVVSLCLGPVLFGSSLACSRFEQDMETIPVHTTEDTPAKYAEEYSKVEIQDPTVQEPPDRPGDKTGEVKKLSEEETDEILRGNINNDNKTDMLIQALSDIPLVRSKALEHLRRIDTPRTRRALDTFFSKSNTEDVKAQIKMDSSNLAINPSISNYVLAHLFVTVTNLSDMPMDFSEGHRYSYTILLKAPNGSYPDFACMTLTGLEWLFPVAPGAKRTLELGLVWNLFDEYCIRFGSNQGFNVKESGTYTVKAIYWLSPDKKVKKIDETLGKFAVSNPIKFKLTLPDK